MGQKHWLVTESVQETAQKLRCRADLLTVLAYYLVITLMYV